jgi:hypothetical protein
MSKIPATHIRPGARHGTAVRNPVIFPLGGD